MSTLSSNMNISETSWPIKAKFYVEPPSVGVGGGGGGGGGGTKSLFATSGSHDQDDRHAHIL